MDKNQALGFVLMAGLLMVYFFFFAPKPSEKPAPIQTTEQQDTSQINGREEPAKTEVETSKKAATANQDTTVTVGDNQQFGIFSSALSGEEKDVTLENDVLKITFSSKGGLYKKVVLKDYKDYQKKDPLVLLDHQSSDIQYLVNTQYGKIDLAKLNYSQIIGPTKNADTLQLEFRLDLGEGKYLSQKYMLGPNSYELRQKTTLEGLSDVVDDNNVLLVWNNDLKRHETDLEHSRNYTTMNYYLSQGSFEHLNQRSKDKQTHKFEQSVSWISFNQKFFTTGIIFPQPINTGEIASSYDPTDTLTVKNCQATVQIPVSEFTANNKPFLYYFGPNKLNILKNVTAGFSDNLNLGWPVVRWINRYVIISLFNFLGSFSHNYGIIIIIMVFIIKLVLSPLTYKSHISMAKTKVLKPELDKIKQQFGDDMQKVQAEQMKLYKQVGVNPLSGCIPMVLQMPILFAMFQFIPYAIELRQKPFLWASDLSTYDSIMHLPFSLPGYGDHVSLFTLLMTISTILYTYANSQATASVQGPMKSMQYVMPVIFLFVLNGYPAGLTFYYFVSNILSFAQIAIIRKFVDDDKIKAILDENRSKNKNKKKSKFQQRLEEAMKASETTKKKKVQR